MKFERRSRIKKTVSKISALLLAAVILCTAVPVEQTLAAAAPGPGAEGVLSRTGDQTGGQTAESSVDTPADQAEGRTTDPSVDQTADRPAAMSEEMASESGGKDTAAAEDENDTPDPLSDYVFSLNGKYLTGEYKGERLTSKYVLISFKDGRYEAVSPETASDDEDISLYYFDKNGDGSVCKTAAVVTISFEDKEYGSYYVSGGRIIRKAATVDCGGKLYKVNSKGIASPYSFSGIYNNKYYISGVLCRKAMKVDLGGRLYKISSNGAASFYKFTGVYGSRYYRNGKRSGVKKTCLIVSGNRLYKVYTSGRAIAYIKNKKKSGTYNTFVSKVLYRVSYKTGSASKFTGVYNRRYYSSGKLGTARGSYYRVYGKYLYRVSRKAEAAVYKRSRWRRGTYKRSVKGLLYNVSYRTGRAAGFTGVYNRKYYRQGALYRKASAASYGGRLYRITSKGAASLYNGVYKNRYYKSGKKSRIRKTSYMVSGGSLYKVYTSGKAALVIKDKKKSGTYKKFLNGVLYDVGYKTGKASKFTGCYKERYYGSGVIDKYPGLGTANAMIKAMQSWIGWSEANGKYKTIIDLYNSVSPLPRGYKMKYRDEWCDACISAAAIKAGCSAFTGRECGCERHIEIFKSKGIWIENGSIRPRPGDIILYNWDDGKQPNNGHSDHIGLVEKVVGSDITVIEGNKGTEQIVERRTIPVGWGYIRGYARPKYRH